MAFDKTKQFKPGEKCERSGVYKVAHDPVHHQEHEVTIVYGEPFPPCNHCGNHPRFVAVRLAQHVNTHEQFKKG